MSDLTYNPHQTWCDTQENISHRCNCIVESYIEKIEALEEKLRVAEDNEAKALLKCKELDNKGKSLMLQLRRVKRELSKLKGGE